MKKKGFTLIELLAVIVILVIIALIATPLILKYIDKSNREALRNSIYSIDRSIVMKGTLDRKDKEYTSTDELDVKIKDTDIKISYVDGETRYYKVSNENYMLDVKKCASKEYCTIEEIEKTKDIIISKNNMFPKVEDSNPGIICGEGLEEDATLSTCYIKSIEDLVQLSNLVNKGTTFQDKTIELVNSLDFNNKNSYVSRKVDDSLISGEGFTPIGNSSKVNFQGTFNGNDNTIKDIYINRPETSYIGLFGHISYATIKDLNIDATNIKGYQYTGSLIGYNNYGTVNNITMKNANIVGNYRYQGGLIGYNNYSILSQININNIKVKGNGIATGGLMSNSSKTLVSDVKAINITVECNGYCGGLTGSNSGELLNIELENIEINNSKEDYAGSLIGSNTGNVENVKYTNIKITNDKNGVGGLVGNNAGGKIKNIIGENIKVDSKNGIYIAGLAGWNHSSGVISNVKIINVEVIGKLHRIGLLVGDNGSEIINSKAEGNVKGDQQLGLISGLCQSCNIKNVVAKGNVEGTYTNNIGGLIGWIIGTSETEVANVSGVYLSGNVTGAKTVNRTIGNYKTYIPILNTLASSTITVNGSTVESTDPTSLNGKSLDNMGKVSQSEYEALGFEFESTDTNEAYWYFNEDDELDLIIK